MVYAINIKICFLVTWLKRAGALGFYGALASPRKNLSVSDNPKLTVQPQAIWLCLDSISDFY
jgi:hypothetical protein